MRPYSCLTILSVIFLSNFGLSSLAVGSFFFFSCQSEFLELDDDGRKVLSVLGMKSLFLSPLQRKK